jgi:hypothetical protein
MGEERCGHARVERPLNSLDRGNGLWAKLIRDGGVRTAHIAQGCRWGPPPPGYYMCTLNGYCCNVLGSGNMAVATASHMRKHK